MCKRNFTDKNEASSGCLRETPQIKNRSQQTQFLVVLFFKAFYTAPFSSNTSFQGFFYYFIFRSLSTQLFFIVVLLFLLLSMSAFSYVGLLSLFRVRLFHALYLSHLPPSSFLEGLSSEQFAELGSVHLLAFSARACFLAFLSSGSPFLTICRAVFVYLVFVCFLFFGLVLRLFSL